MKKLFLAVSFFALASMASAATVFVQCDSPGANINPPSSVAIGASTCVGFFNAVNGGAAAAGPTATQIIDNITLISRYAVSLQLGGAAGSADFNHTVNNIGVTSYNNAGPTTANSPFLDLTWGSGSNCVGSTAAACAVLTALAGGTVNVTSNALNPTGQTSSVSVDYAFQIDFHDAPSDVPEPTTISLVGLALIGLGLSRKFRR